MLLFAKGSPQEELNQKDLKNGLISALDRLGQRKKVLAVPPDATRAHSRAGELTRFALEYFGDALTDILPATGTHTAMTASQIGEMFPGVPKKLFKRHDWRKDILTLGEVPAEYVSKVSGGAVSYSWPAQVNKLLTKGGHDLILSIGQVVPHEVAGMANYNKNIFVGTGGADGINKSHFLGAAFSMEKIMGRADTPVRRVLNYASDNFAGNLPQIVYALTVVGRNGKNALCARGLFIGDDIECFNLASDLSLKVNIQLLDKPLKKVVIYLNPNEFRSTWLGNKAIYRTRMAIADGGELIIMAPGVKTFGEDPEIDRLIRKYGYTGTPEIMKATADNDDLKNNLSAAAHLIHGSSENRFKITYCPGGLTRKEIESVNFSFGELDEMRRKYDTGKLEDGFNTLRKGEKIFYISNPAIGLWSAKRRMRAKT